MKLRVWPPITQRFDHRRKPLVRVGVAIWTPVLLALICSYISGDWQWLARSGSLVVAVTIYAEKKGWLSTSKALRAGVLGTFTWGWGDLLGLWL